MLAAMLCEHFCAEFLLGGGGGFSFNLKMFEVSIYEYVCIFATLPLFKVWYNSFCFNYRALINKKPSTGVYATIPRAQYLL